MATALSASIHALVPSENWDDDFEFQQHMANTTNSPLRKISKSYKNDDGNGGHNNFEPMLPTSGTRMSIASSQFTEDWDADSHAFPRRSGSEFDDNSSKILTNGSMKISGGILSDRINLKTPPSELSDWSESAPLTPSKRFHPHTTENWDDDFEDKADSPARKSIISTPPSTKPPNSTRSGGHSSRIQRRRVEGDDAHESWDEEFGLGPSPLRRIPQNQGSPSSPSRKPRHRRIQADIQQHPDYSSSSEEDIPHQRTQPLQYPPSDDEDDDMELGYAEREDDRTVTARSRRAALSRLTSQTSSSTVTAAKYDNSSPPPPVPALPLPFLLNPTSAPAIPSSPHPFPRSPTSSVFSVPTTLAETRSYTSTTYLRSTPSRASSGLGHLPPSPPIHKERERRRLRKKSRPQPNGVFEMATIPAGQTQSYSFSDGEPENGPRVGEDQMSGVEDDCIHPRAPRTPSPPPRPAASMPATPSGGAGKSSSSATPLTSNKGAALLSRIGSVTRWRRKRGSSMTPSEVASNGGILHRMDARFEHDLQLTPRPQSSLSSLHHSASRSSNNTSNHNPSSPPTSNSWFFRASSAGSPLSNLGAGSSTGSRSGSMTDLSLRERDRERASMYTPSPESSLGMKGKESSALTPSKLIKRKSLGFVHLRRGLGGHNGGENEMINGTTTGEVKRPMSMVGKGVGESQQTDKIQTQPRHASYGATGVGRPGRGNGSEGRDRKRSFARSKSRDPFASTDAETDKENDKGKEKEGARGFMGNVRRMSLVGRHNRTKSGVSMANVGEEIVLQTPSRPLTPSTSYPHLPGSRRRSTDAKSSLNDKSVLDPPPVPKTPEKPPEALLPPIELQPPSPPQVKPSVSASNYLPLNAIDGLSPKGSSSFNNQTTASLSPARLGVKSPSSPQSASLGRSTAGTASSSNSGGAVGGNGATAVPRRNSLGDLKIPARISQAQVSLRRDLGMVREFAANVEQLKDLQVTYHDLATEVQTILDRHAELHLQQRHPLPRTTSPNFFNNLSRPKMRRRASTNPETLGPSSAQLAYKEIASAFYTINSKYRISWECAELLIDLGSGNAGSVSAPPTSASAPAIQDGTVSAIHEGKKNRERAITLAGDESKPSTPIPDAASSAGDDSPNVPPLASPSSWRASPGRHDLSQRQLSLLREMLKNTDLSLVSDGSRLSIPEEPSSSLIVNRDWRWGDPMSSTITLPSEDSLALGDRSAAPTKPRRSSRLGMSGIRDMLRTLKRNIAEGPPPPIPPVPPVLASSTSLSTESSADTHSRHRYPHPRIPVPEHRPKSRHGPPSMRDNDESDTKPTSPYHPPVPKSPRRPSLASIFRLGNKNKATTPPTSIAHVSNHTSLSTSVPTQSGQESSSTGEEDWDQIDSASDLDAAARALGIGSDGSATVRGLKGLDTSPYLLRDPYGVWSTSGPIGSRRSISGSQTSLHGEPLSNNAIPSRSTRLSNVEEQVDDHRLQRTPSISKSYRAGQNMSRPPSRTSKAPKSASVRSMPPQFVSATLADLKLSVTPDNIKPLLENAREVYGRLVECIAEIRTLVGQVS